MKNLKNETYLNFRRNQKAKQINGKTDFVVTRFIPKTTQLIFMTTKSTDGRLIKTLFAFTHKIYISIFLIISHMNGAYANNQEKAPSRIWFKYNIDKSSFMNILLLTPLTALFQHPSLTSILHLSNVFILIMVKRQCTHNVLISYRV